MIFKLTPLLSYRLGFVEAGGGGGGTSDLSGLLTCGGGGGGGGCGVFPAPE